MAKFPAQSSSSTLHLLTYFLLLTTPGIISDPRIPFKKISVSPNPRSNILVKQSTNIIQTHPTQQATSFHSQVFNFPIASKLSANLKSAKFEKQFITSQHSVTLNISILNRLPRILAIHIYKYYLIPKENLTPSRFTRRFNSSRYKLPFSLPDVAFSHNTTSITDSINSTYTTSGQRTFKAKKIIHTVNFQQPWLFRITLFNKSNISELMSQTSYNPPAMDIIQEEINDTHMTTLDPTSIKRSREPNAEPEISNKISLSEQQCSTMDIITMDNNDNYFNSNIGNTPSPNNNLNHDSTTGHNREDTPSTSQTITGNMATGTPGNPTHCTWLHVIPHTAMLANYNVRFPSTDDIR